MFETSLSPDGLGRRFSWLSLKGGCLGAGLFGLLEFCRFSQVKSGPLVQSGDFAEDCPKCAQITLLHSVARAPLPQWNFHCSLHIATCTLRADPKHNGPSGSLGRVHRPQMPRTDECVLQRRPIATLCLSPWKLKGNRQETSAAPASYAAINHHQASCVYLKHNKTMPRERHLLWREGQRRERESVRSSSGAATGAAVAASSLGWREEISQSERND